jgi:hypothetical protein
MLIGGRQVSQRDDQRDNHSSINVETRWCLGTRTPVWDALWRQIFADLGDDLDQPASDDEVSTAGCRLPTAEPGQDEV